MSLGSLLMTPLLVLTRLNLCGVPSCVSTTFPPVASRAAATCAVPASPLVSRLSQVNLLDITGSQLRVAVQRISAHSACGADGWRRSELLALPAPFWDMLASILCGMATAGVVFGTLASQPW